MVVRHVWSIQEANDALPAVRQMLALARETEAALRDADDQVQDLKTAYGDDVQRPDHQEHGAWLLWTRRLARARRDVDVAFAAFAERQIVLKDLALGLVDFCSRRGDEPVWLCWRDGEDTVAWWHSLRGGLGARQPLPELDVTGV